MQIDKLYNIYLSHPTITTDSRNCPDGSIFFALKGANFNGNKFAAKALEEGCAYAVIDEEEFSGHSNIILVNDVLETMTQLATYHRLQLNKPVIAITGTNGKTTTKELVKQVLEGCYTVCATSGNFNNHIGLPLTLLRAKESDDIILTEMGANHPGEIAYLCNIAKPNFGIITNIGKAHLEGFGSYENIIKTKGEMYDYLRENNGTIFINTQDDVLNSISNGIQKVSYGDEELYNVEVTDQTPTLSIAYNDSTQTIAVDTRFIGAYNLINFKAAIAVGKYFKVPDAVIMEQISKYTPQNNRSQLTVTPNNKIIQDAYNANPSSVALAIKNFAQLKMDEKFVILGDMKELGTYAEKEHQHIADLLMEHNFTKGLLVGEEFGKLELPQGWIQVADASKAGEYLKSHPLKNNLILLKGSRSMQLEKLIEYI